MKYHQQWILLAILVCCMIAGSLGVWIHFPLSMPVRGLDWHSLDLSWPRRFPAAPFIFFNLLAVLLLLLGKQRAGSIFFAVSVVALLAVPGLSFLVDNTWLQTYIEDGTQFDKFQFYIPYLEGIPSTSFDPYLNSSDQFQYLPDRARIILAMLGWGWSICLVYLFVLAILLSRIGKLPSIRRVISYSAAGMFLIVVIGSNALRADFNYRKGDQLLGLGDYKSALQAYSHAIDLDSQLANSGIFLRNVAKAYYQLKGGSDPHAYLYMADAVTFMDKGSAKALLITSPIGNDSSVLGQALSRMSQKKISELWINEAIHAYKHEDYGTAALGLRRVLSENNNLSAARYFLARVLSKMHEFDEATLQYNNLLPAVSNDSIRAAIYSAMGDAQAGAGHVDEARKSYAMSYSLDNTNNLWALKGLGGT